MQQVHRVEPGFAPDVDEVAEIPAYQMVHMMNGAEGNVAGVVRKLRGDDTGGEIGLGQAFSFRREGQEIGGRVEP